MPISTKYLDPTDFKFSQKQVDSIINKIVPLVASTEDQNFFKAALYAVEDGCSSSAQFTTFISKLLKKHKQIQA